MSYNVISWKYNSNNVRWKKDPYLTLNHHEFDIITRKIKLVDENICKKYNDPNRVTFDKILNCFENLTVGDVIDARDSLSGKFYLAKIVDIKDKEYGENDCKDINNDDNINCKSNIAIDSETKLSKLGGINSMKIRVHYQGCDKKYDEWIDITKETSRFRGEAKTTSSFFFWGGGQR